MIHVAIMNPRLGLIEKIVSGEKKIESRWMKNKSAPWLRVSVGDEIYFKKSGGFVSAVATVEKVRYIDNLNAKKSRQIIEKYGKKICLEKAPAGKNYCVLIWLAKPRKVEAIKIKKRGRAGWMTK